MVGAGRGTRIIDWNERESSCPTAVISLTLHPVPGRHADEGAVVAAVVAALDRRFPGVDAIRVAVDHRPVEARPSSNRGG